MKHIISLLSQAKLYANELEDMDWLVSDLDDLTEKLRRDYD